MDSMILVIQRSITLKTTINRAHVDMCASKFNQFFVSGNFNTESDNNDETDFCRRYN